MKKTVILLIFLIFSKVVIGQAYIITYIKGKVYHNDQLLKLHDKLDGITQITSSDKSAELALFSAEKGKFRLSFVNSKPVAASQASKRSELYQLIVGNYLLSYTTEKTLTSRGDFDLKVFFSPADPVNGSNLYLPEGTLLPVKCQSLTLGPTDKFFICTRRGNDTLCSEISRKGSFLIFDAKTIESVSNNGGQNPEPVSCFIKRGHIFNNRYIEERFSGPVNVTFLPKEYLQNLTGSFEEGMASYYQDNKGKLITDMEDQLSYYYGRCFEPAVHQVLSNYVK